MTTELSVLFWNFNYSDSDKEAIVSRVAIEHKVDVLVLAESTVDPDVLLAELKQSEPAYERR
jgi:hypothetical protein